MVQKIFCDFVIKCNTKRTFLKHYNKTSNPKVLIKQEIKNLKANGNQADQMLKVSVVQRQRELYEWVTDRDQDKEGKPECT